MSDFTPIIPDESNITEDGNDIPPTEGGMQSDAYDDFFSEDSSYSEPNSTEENSSMNSDLDGISNAQNSGFDGVSSENAFQRGQNASNSTGSSSSEETFNFNSSDDTNEGSSFDNFNANSGENDFSNRNHFEGASEIKNKAEKTFSNIHLGYKQVAMLIAGVLLALAILISVIYNVASSKKTTNSPSGIPSSTQS